MPYRLSISSLYRKFHCKNQKVHESSPIKYKQLINTKANVPRDSETPFPIVSLYDLNSLMLSLTGKAESLHFHLHCV